MALANRLAADLGARRKQAAPALERAMEEMLGDLALEGARFEVAFTDRELFEGGGESVELRVAANPGENARPIAKVASGGELSRIALALHLLTSQERETEGSARTMVFDEVDAGVGGRAAQSVGRALADLTRVFGGPGSPRDTPSPGCRIRRLPLPRVEAVRRRTCVRAGRPRRRSGETRRAVADARGNARKQESARAR